VNTQTLPSHSDSQINEALAAFVDKKGALGVTAALIKHGEWVWSGSAGYRTLARDEKLPPDAVFPIFSITKTFVAVLALRLVDQEALRLEAPVATWLPELPRADGITLRHLLNQASGIPDYGDQRAYHEAVQAHPSEPWTLKEILACALDKPFEFEPGASWAYSNPNYWILGYILEQVTKTSLQAALDKHVTRPLGLKHTSYPRSSQDAITPGFSTYLNEDGPEVDISRGYNTRWAGPAGAMLSTATDVAYFYDALLSGKLLSPNAQAALLDLTFIPGDFPEWYQPYYGLGLFCQKGTGLGTLYGHGGSGPGYQTLAQYIVDHQLTAVVLSNSDRIAPDGLLYPFIKRLLSEGMI